MMETWVQQYRTAEDVEEESDYNSLPENGGWAVRQVAPFAKGAYFYGFLVVYERHRAEAFG